MSSKAEKIRTAALKKGRSRATILSLVALCVVVLAIPMTMGVMSGWNDWIGDNSGNSFWVREKADLDQVDFNTSYNGDVLFRYENATNVTRWADQTVTYGNSTNYGYHTIAAVVGANEGANATDAGMYWRLNCSGKDLRDNNTISISMDLADFGGIKPTITVYLHDSGVAISDLSGDADIYQVGNVTGTTALNTTVVTFTTLTVEFSILDIITAEDAVGPDNYVLVQLVANTGTIEEADECYWRLYDSSLNNFGVMNTQAGLDFAYFGIGMFLLVAGFYNTPWLNFNSPGVKSSMSNTVGQARLKRRRGR